MNFLMGLAVLCVVFITFIVVWSVAASYLNRRSDNDVVLLAACDYSFADPNCHPETVYLDHCLEDNQECEEFCRLLTPSDSRYCMYMDSCLRYVPEMARLCASPPNCIDNCVCSSSTLNGCSPALVRQYCVSGAASEADCADYCENYFLCSWAESTEYKNEMKDVCKQLNKCR